MRKEFRRQVVHLSGFLFVILAYFSGRTLAIAYFGIIALFFLIYSLYVRSHEKRMMRILHRMESRFRDLALGFERESDFQNPFRGAFFFYFSCTLTMLLFPFFIGLAACSILAIGDSVSTLIGISVGRRKIWGSKTFEGSVGFFISSLIVAAFFVSPYLALSGALAGTFAEAQDKINDNVAVPLVSAFVMLILTLL